MLLDSPTISDAPYSPRSPKINAILSRLPQLAIERDHYNINVTANGGDRLDVEHLLSRYVAHNGSQKPAHLYFHVPLCSYLCHFCNYVKRLVRNGSDRDRVLDEWVALLIDESACHLRLAPWLQSARIESCYIGGGTASLLHDVQLERLLAHVHSNYDMSTCVEFTLEGNPDNFLGSEAISARQLGFNRFSMGVQSLQSDVNRFAGRGHDADMSLRAIDNLAQTGCPFNVDMMFGLPFQTADTFAKDIETLLDLGVPTVTIYRLRNADRHSMGIGNRAAWNLPVVKDRLEAKQMFPTLAETYAMREAAVDVFLGRGYIASPCGWWSAPGTYPNGNIPQVSRNKWEHHDTMIACGPGAYGWLAGDDGTITQTHNETDIGKYVQSMREVTSPPFAFGRLLSGRGAVATAFGFAYKANQRISTERFRGRFGVDLLADEPYRPVVEEMIEQGLLVRCEEGRALKPTLDGESVHEEVISSYIHHRIGTFDEPVCRRCTGGN